MIVRLKIHVPDALRDALSSLLFDAGASGLEEEPGALCVYATEQSHLDAFKGVVERLQEVDSSQPLSIEYQEVSNAWNQCWQGALRAEPLTHRLVLRPTHDRPAPPEEETLWFEPDASFGDGGHPTTRLAAQFIDEFVSTQQPSSMLDVGCGSGVLSMVAALRGVSKVLAVDIDNVAVSSAETNLRLNHLEEKVTVRKGNADFTLDKFDLVVANINTPILRSLCESLSARTRSGGTLLLTGLLEEDEDELSSLYAGVGLVLQSSVRRDGWTLLEFLAQELDESSG